MADIPMCTNCGNTKKGDSAKKCAKCGKITCQKCSFSKCTCGSSSYSASLKIA